MTPSHAVLLKCDNGREFKSSARRFYTVQGGSTGITGADVQVLEGPNHRSGGFRGCTHKIKRVL